VNSESFLYAALAGVSMAAYIIGMRLAAPGTHPAVGTAIITGIACVTNVAVVLVIRASGTPTPFSMTSLRFLVVVGLATAAVNLFTLLAYASGLRVTSSFVIGGVSTALVLLVGFLILREPFSLAKLIAIGLILAGTVMLQRIGVGPAE
jgi:uncharacterized membrane protein